MLRKQYIQTPRTPYFEIDITTQRSIDRDRSAARDTAASQDHPLTWSVMSMVMMLPMFPSSLSWGSVTPVSS